MTTQPVTALIVPHGKIIDFIDDKFRDETPEEYVRQEIEKSIVREYLYPREEVAVEFPIKLGTSRKRVDIAIFPEGEAHKQETIWAIIECKSADVSPDNKSDGVEQLKSYMAGCANAEFGMWTNGRDRFCFRKIIAGSKISFAEPPPNDLPTKGKSLDDAERPTPVTLKEATSDSLLFAFKRCHNYIHVNQGLQKPEAFWELLKVIFCKIADERSSEIQFYATTQERQSLNGQLKVKSRLDRLFAEVRSNYSSIFKQNDAIDLTALVLAYVVAQLQSYSLLESDIDVKGKAYEEIVGSNLRGDTGEFFTPRNICKMAVEMMDPSPHDLIIDPACGTGGFLITAMNHVAAKIRSAEEKKWKKERPSERELGELFRKLQAYAQEKLIGIDLNPNLVKAAKMNMVMNNDGSGGLYQAHSLARPVTWDKALRDRDLFNKADIIFTNPPFGSKLPVDGTMLEQYELGHAWSYDEPSDAYTIKEPRTLLKSQPPEILFIERCIQLLKPGSGKLCIVLPDAILGAPGLAHVREWILTNTRIVASIDLHPDTFQPKNSTQTSLLVLKRKSWHQIELEKAARKKNAYNVFLALANHVGHDKRGNVTYVRDENGDEKIETVTETVKEIRDGAPTYKKVTTKRKKIDDNTRGIALKFKEWAAEQADL